MRTLAQELGVVPMALYKHVANKEELLDGMVDIVFGEVEFPSSGADWKTAMRQRGISMRQALSRHRLGDRPDGVPDATRARELATPQRGDGVSAGGRLLIQDGRPRLLRPGQLHLRVCAPGEELAVRDPRGVRRGGGDEAEDAPAGCRRGVPVPRRGGRRARQVG